MIKIDGHRLDEYDMVVLTDHQNPILPAIQDKTVKIPGVPGLYDFGSEISPKYFDIPIGIKPQQDYASIRQKVEQFKKIILDEYGHPKEFELIFDYFPERYYKAKVNSMGISLERLITMGRFNLPLVAYDPFAYADAKAYDEPPGEYADVTAQYTMQGKTVVNHVPLFDSGLWTFHANVTVDSPTKITHVNTSGTGEFTVIDLNLKENQEFTISLVGDGGYVTVAEKDELNTTLTTLASSLVNGTYTKTFTTTSGYAYVRVSVYTQSAGTFTFENIMLNEGTTAQEFVANVKGVTNPILSNHTNGSYQIIKSTFYEGDQLTWDENGQPRKIKKHEEVLLDGSLDWGFKLDYTGYKRVEINEGGLSNSGILPDDDSVLVKHDGLILFRNSNMTDADQWDGDYGWGSAEITLTISDTDSGWTDAMTPSSNFIKAYFNGWKYTGDGTSHSWVNMYDDADTTTDVNVCLSRNTHAENGKEGYRLIYELAQAEDVAVDYEGNVYFSNGDYHVDVSENVELDYLSANIDTIELTYPIQQMLERGSNIVSLSGFSTPQYDSGLMYENVESFEWIYSTHYTGAYNYSHYQTPLILTIEGSVINPRITDLRTGKTMRLPTIVNQTLEVDCSKYTVTVNGQNAFSDSENVDLHLLSGDIQLKFEGGNPNATVTMKWKHRFM